MADEVKILTPDAQGRFSLSDAHLKDIQRVDISDVDLVITLQNGTHYVVPGGGVSAMESRPPVVAFADGNISSADLLGEVGTVKDLASQIPLPSSVKQDSAKQGGTQDVDAAQAQKIQKLEKQIIQLQKQLQEESKHKHDHDQDQTHKHDHDYDQQSVSALTQDTVSTVEQMVQQAQQVVDQMHAKDFDYVPPEEFKPIPSPPSAPPGVPPPISMTPIVTLFMGNIVGTTSDTTSNPGYTTYYGGGGAIGSDAGSQIGPRNALQYSPATIDTTATTGNVIVYADGPLVGNTNPASQSFSYYSKQLILNVAGYFTTLNPIQISGVPAGVSFVGATNDGGGNWTLPASMVLNQTPFTILYSTSGTGTFDVQFTITGVVTRGAAFTSVQTIEFQYMNVTDTSQVTNPTLVYDDNGLSKEIYVLPTQDQPNIITAGNGNDIIYGGRNTDTITLGNGNNTVTDYNGAGDSITVGNGNNTITLGNGTGDSVTAGNGNNTITVGGAEVMITAGSGSNTITTAGGGGTISAGAGGADTNSVTINSTTGSTDVYTISLLGTGVNTVTGGDDDYAITLGNATNTVTIGNSTSNGNGVTTFDTTITAGNGNSSITTGSGTHEITIGAANTASSIETGSGNNTFIINSAANSTANYSITATQGGNSIIETTNGGVANTQGDGDYQIDLGNGSSTITLGNSTAIDNGTSAFDTNITTGTGNSIIMVGTGEHDISVGAGTANINISASDTANNKVTSVSGGGTITSNGTGINTIVAGSGTYTISATGSGNNIVTISGTDTLALGNGNNAITVSGSGSNIMSVGNGNNTVSGAGATGSNTLTAGSGLNNVILGTNGASAAGSGNTIIISNGNVGTPSAAGSPSVYSLYGAANNTVKTATGSTGNGNYNITLGNATGTNTVSIGNGYSQVVSPISAYTAYDTWILAGTGASNITAGSGDHYISVGAGATAINVTGTDTGSNYIAVAGGGGSITLADNGANTITASGSGSYAISATGTGNDTITMAGGGGTIRTGNGVNNITVTSGNYTITTGNGYEDIVTAGSGNNIINMGTGGGDVITLGTGSSTLNVGLGTSNTITGGAGTNTLNFSSLTVPLTIAFGTVTGGAGTASGTGVGDTFSGFTGTTDITGTNYGDTITLGSGSFNVTDGSGASITDTITLGSGTDSLTINNTTATSITDITLGSGTATVHAGNGTNTITGTNLTTATSDSLIGGSGNNTFLSPDAGTTYNGTNNAALAAKANNPAYTYTNTTGTDPFANATNVPSFVGHTYSGGVSTVTLYLNTQLNLINYSNSGTTALTINLASGIGSGGTAQGSTYTFTPTAGYSTINGIIGDNGGDTFSPSYSNTILIGGYGSNTFNDGSTLASQTVIMVGNDTNTYGGADYYNMGPGSDIIVGSLYNWNQISYYSSPVPIAVNFDSVSHTFSSSLFTSSVTISAYSGANWGNNYANSSTSYSTEDYFVPVSGTQTYINDITGNPVGDIIYGGSTNLDYYVEGGNSYFYAGSGGSFYNTYGSGPASTPNVAVGTGGTANTLDASSPSNMFIILNPHLDTGTQSSKDSSFNLTYGGTTYAGVVYGWGNVTTPTGNFVTYISGYDMILSSSGNDYIVGDNNNDQINAETGTNTIILGGGNNIVDALQGNNTITLSTNATLGTNTLNFETTNDSYSGVLANQSTSATSGVFVFLNNSSETSFFGTNDQQVIWGTNYASGKQVLTGNGISSVQSSIVSLINGSDYSSGTTDSSANNTFEYDNMYSGAANIRAHSGNNVFLDDLGTGSETFYAGTGSNIYYLTPSQITSNLTISGTASTTGDNVLRVEGWGAGSGFGTDPFTSTGAAQNIRDINVIDVRSGQDSVNTATDTITLGANSTSHTGTFNLSAADVQYINGNGSSSKVILLLDSGETFTPTAGQHYYAEGSAAAGSGNWQYYIGYSSTPTSYGQAGYTAIIDVHYGTGAFSSSGISSTYHASA